MRAGTPSDGRVLRHAVGEEDNSKLSEEVRHRKKLGVLVNRRRIGLGEIGRRKMRLYEAEA